MTPSNRAPFIPKKLGELYSANRRRQSDQPKSDRLSLSPAKFERSNKGWPPKSFKCEVLSTFTEFSKKSGSTAALPHMLSAAQLTYDQDCDTATYLTQHFT